MPVLITVEAKQQTREGYEGMRSALTEVMKTMPGFILHTSHPTEDGWRVFEIWASEADQREFFVKHVAPNLPSGVQAKRSVQLLHDVVTG